MKTTLVALSAMVLLAAQGCGFAGWKAELCQRPSHWPLGPVVEGNALAIDQTRPTLLVRTKLAGKEAADLWKDRHVRAPYESSLFASVVHDSSDAKSPPIATDFTLDLTIDANYRVSGLIAPGVITLGILPIPFPMEFTVNATVRNASGEELGSQMRTDRHNIVLCTLLLPFNVIASCAHAGGAFCIPEWSDAEREIVENMVASCIARMEADGCFRARSAATADAKK